MRDETRDALLIAVADLAIAASWVAVAGTSGAEMADVHTHKARDLLKRAKHEIEDSPND